MALGARGPPPYPPATMPRARLIPVLVPLLVTLLGCRSAEIASVNLDELMTDEHRFRYSAQIRTGFSSYLEAIIDPSWFEDDSLLAGGKEKPIPNPTQVCLANLLDLRKEGVGLSGPFLEAEQVRQFARYAVFCPSNLGRERAFLELAAHAQRLEIEEVELAPGQAANAPELTEGLRGLREVLVRLAGAHGQEDETTRRDFAAACELLGKLELDVEGGRRLLHLIAAFGQLPSLEDEQLGPLLELSTGVQRRVTALALARGRYDPDGRVRAAAYRANYAAYGPAFLEEALRALLPPTFTEQGRVKVTEGFRLLPERGEQEDVFLTVFELLRANGLPSIPGSLPSVAIGRRLLQLHVLMQVAHDFSAYPDRVRAEAMATLNDVSGADITSLREEDWGRWWKQYSVLEGERRKRAEAAEAQDDPEEDPGAGGDPPSESWGS
jgi:hypothetical protein